VARYQCPHCAKRLDTVEASVTATVVQVYLLEHDAGKVRLSFNNEEVDRIHGDLEIVCPRCNGDLTPQLQPAHMDEGEFVPIGEE
jgi:predicted nucleic acid-binding Zn ribbon protein